MFVKWTVWSLFSDWRVGCGCSFTTLFLVHQCTVYLGTWVPGKTRTFLFAKTRTLFRDNTYTFCVRVIANRKKKYRPSPVKLSPPQKPVFCPDGQFQGRGGQFQGSRGDNLCSPFFTPKRPPPYSTRNCPPFLPYVILPPPHFFPQGGQFQGGRRGGQFHGGGSVYVLSQFTQITIIKKRNTHHTKSPMGEVVMKKKSTPQPVW